MNVEKSTIIIPVRTEYEEVKLAIKYAKQNQSVEHEYLIIYDIENKKDSIEKLEGVTQLFPTYDDVKFIEVPNSKLKQYSIEQNRLGIIALYEYGMKIAKTKYCFILHSDMIPGPNWDKKMFKYMDSKTTVCGTRIEPKIFGADKAKFQEDCGINAKEFDYNKFELSCKKYSEDKVVEGFFAPHLYNKEEFLGYDARYCPQSRDEQVICMKMYDKGYKMLNSRSAMFYHFAAMGSRRKDNRFEDSSEWKQSNYKNERNFIRQFRQPILTNEYCLTIKKDYKETIALGIGFKYDDSPYLIKKVLRYHEPYFDNIYINIDSTQNSEKVLNAINEYIQEEINMCEIFDPLKFKINIEPLNGDFANMRNNIMKLNQCDWILQIDPDEFFDINDLQNMRELVHQANPDKNTKVIGLPRVNFIDNKIVNDIPRDNRGNFIGI